MLLLWKVVKTIFMIIGMIILLVASLIFAPIMAIWEVCRQVFCEFMAGIYDIWGGNMTIKSDIHYPAEKDENRGKIVDKYI